MAKLPVLERSQAFEFVDMMESKYFRDGCKYQDLESIDAVGHPCASWFDVIVSEASLWSTKHLLLLAYAFPRPQKIDRDGFIARWAPNPSSVWYKEYAIFDEDIFQCAIRIAICKRHGMIGDQDPDLDLYVSCFVNPPPCDLDFKTDPEDDDLTGPAVVPLVATAHIVEKKSCAFPLPIPRDVNLFKLAVKSVKRRKDYDRVMKWIQLVSTHRPIVLLSASRPFKRPEWLFNPFDLRQLHRLSIEFGDTFPSKKRAFSLCYLGPKFSGSPLRPIACYYTDARRIRCKKRQHFLQTYRNMMRDSPPPGPNLPFSELIHQYEDGKHD